MSNIYKSGDSGLAASRSRSLAAFSTGFQAAVDAQGSGDLLAGLRSTIVELIDISRDLIERLDDEASPEPVKGKPPTVLWLAEQYLEQHDTASTDEIVDYVAARRGDLGSADKIRSSVTSMLSREKARFLTVRIGGRSRWALATSEGDGS